MTKKKALIEKAKEVEVTKAPVITKEELARMFKEQMDATIRACRKELDESNKLILDKYQCDLEVTMMLTPRGNIPNISVVPRPPRQ